MNFLPNKPFTLATVTFALVLSSCSPRLSGTEEKGVEGRASSEGVEKTPPGDRGAATPVAEPLLKPGCRIACLGDSITAGRADEPGLKSYVDVLNTISDANFPPPAPWFIPFGDGGETMEMIANYWTRAERRNPSLVYIQDGGLPITPLEKYEKILRTLVKKAKLSGAEVLLSTTAHFRMEPPFRWDQHNPLIERIAGEEGCILVPVEKVLYRIEEKLGGKGFYMTKDGKHPTALGNFVMALTILKSLGLSPGRLKLGNVNLPEELKERVVRVIEGVS